MKYPKNPSILYQIFHPMPLTDFEKEFIAERRKIIENFYSAVRKEFEPVLLRFATFLSKIIK